MVIVRPACLLISAKIPNLPNALMGRWPDNNRSTMMTAVLIFVVFPLLCWLAIRFVNG
jgi:hypothetical protein